MAFEGPKLFHDSVILRHPHQHQGAQHVAPTAGCISLIPKACAVLSPWHTARSSGTLGSDVPVGISYSPHHSSVCLLGSRASDRVLYKKALLLADRTTPPCKQPDQPQGPSITQPHCSIQTPAIKVHADPQPTPQDGTKAQAALHGPMLPMGSERLSWVVGGSAGW